MKCDSRASFLARTFASPCLGHKSKAKVVTTFFQHPYSQEPNIPLTTLFFFFVIDVTPIFVDIVDALVQICDKSPTFIAFFSGVLIKFFHFYCCCLCLSKNHIFSCSIFVVEVVIAYASQICCCIVFELAINLYKSDK
jgi:hypothetical protein